MFLKDKRGELWLIISLDHRRLNMKKLQALYDRCDALSMPDKATEEELDEQIFMVIDIETMLMAYAEAVLTDIQPKFSLDGDNLEYQTQLD